MRTGWCKVGYNIYSPWLSCGIPGKLISGSTNDPIHPPWCMALIWLLLHFRIGTPLSNTNTKLQMLHWNLTWNLQMMVSKRNLVFQGLIFRFHVKPQGDIGLHDSCSYPFPIKVPKGNSAKALCLSVQLMRPSSSCWNEALVFLEETCWTSHAIFWHFGDLIFLKK